MQFLFQRYSSLNKAGWETKVHGKPDALPPNSMKILAKQRPSSKPVPIPAKNTISSNPQLIPVSWVAGGFCPGAGKVSVRGRDGAAAGLAAADGEVVNADEGRNLPAGPIWGWGRGGAVYGGGEVAAAGDAGVCFVKGVPPGRIMGSRAAGAGSGSRMVMAFRSSASASVT